MYGGFVNGFHDASIAIVDEEGTIAFASASERYARIKHCSILGDSLLARLDRCTSKIYYEDLRQHSAAGSLVNPAEWKRLPPSEKTDRARAFRYADLACLREMTMHPIDHHRAHAAASFFTRPWETVENTVILTVDGIGSDLMTANNIYVFDQQAGRFICLHSDSASLGALYTACASYAGFGDFEEGSFMGLAPFGEPTHLELVEELYQLCYHGPQGNQYLKVGDEGICELVRVRLERDAGPGRDIAKEDLAASAQAFLEQKLLDYARRARQYGSRLCYAGGVAQNVVANSRIAELFDAMWIVSDPTDGGSSLGAAAWGHFAETGKTRVHWEGPYLGHAIERKCDPLAVVEHLLQKRVCGIAHGRAEFGPRALGNRSLLGDVRYAIQDTVNSIKRREPFRPFGPAVLEEHFDDYFEGQANRLMQFVAKAKHDFSSVIHKDGTCRVQTVPHDSPSVLRQVLEEYFRRTGVPMLLNTSLNIRGMPMVNDLQDAQAFERAYKVRVF